LFQRVGTRSSLWGTGHRFRLDIWELLELHELEKSLL
jgi:hypothetical protein